MTAPTTTSASTGRPGEPPTRHSKSLTERIIEVVADTADTSPQELPPFYEVVNPEALNHLFVSIHKGKTRAAGQVTLAYVGYEIIRERRRVEAIQNRVLSRRGSDSE